MERTSQREEIVYVNIPWKERAGRSTARKEDSAEQSGTHSDKRVDGVRIGDSGEEGSRDQTVKGYMCMQRNLS